MRVAVGEKASQAGYGAVQPDKELVDAARDLDDTLVFGGGVIPDADARALKEQGITEIFQPGASLRAISAWLENALDERDDQ